jgi:hypothetical protein
MIEDMTTGEVSIQTAIQPDNVTAVPMTVWSILLTFEKASKDPSQ